MELNELFEKFLNDESFKEEVEDITDENSFNDFAQKYDIPYTIEEINTFINDKLESANGNCSIYSKKTYEELGIDLTGLTMGKQNHPLIVTESHKCKYNEPYSAGFSNNCLGCKYSNEHVENFVAHCYCNLRSKEYDPVYRK